MCFSLLVLAGRAPVLRCAIVVLGCLSSPRAAASQERGEPRGRESTIGFGVSWNAPVEFNGQRCGSKVATSVGTGFNREVAPRFWLGLRGDLVYGNPFKRDKCFFETVTAPTPSGPSDVIRSEATSSVPQYSFVQVAGLAGVNPIDSPSLRVRLYGGAAAVAFKPVLPLFYGIEVLPRFGQHRLAIAVEQWRWSVRFDSVQYHFENGDLVTRTATGFNAIRQPIFVRVSSVSGFGGRGPR